ncbi:MAG: AAA family ATPase [Candidatus Absconditabacteria bacterium]
MAHIGKTSLVLELSKKILGKNFMTDFLHIKDLTELVGKEHVLKVSTDKDEFIDLGGGLEYRDYGAREIIEWLNITSVGSHKILLIENIERMNLSSLNSFLKTLEEPLKNRLIIATTTNRMLLLDTIISRSLLLKFTLPDDNLVIEFLQNKYPNLDSQQINILLSVCTGRIGMFIQIMEGLDTGEDMHSMLSLFTKYIEIIEKKGKYTSKLEILNQVNKQGMIDNFLLALVYYCDNHGLYDHIDKIFQTKNLLKSNVNPENSFFYMILD